MSAYDKEEDIALRIARAAAQKILDEAIAESTAAGWSKYNGEWSVVQTGERYLIREYQGYIGRRIAYEMQLAGVIRSRSNSIASNASNGLATAQTQMIQMQISDATPSPSRSPIPAKLRHSQSFDSHLHPASASHGSRDSRASSSSSTSSLNIAYEDEEAAFKDRQALDAFEAKQKFEANQELKQFLAKQKFEDEQKLKQFERQRRR
jgi:hypothetical protein